MTADELQHPDDDQLTEGDSYTEGPYLVFTAQYLRRRGYCCHSDCRHCPYKDEDERTGG